MSLFLRALSLMGYTLEIKKDDRPILSNHPGDYPAGGRGER